MIVAGFGFTSRATQGSLMDALRQTGHAEAVDMLATAEDKAARLTDLCNHMQSTIVGIPSPTLQAMQTETQSDISRAHRHTGSLAEAAALAAAGPGARLIITRCISSDREATCAIAQGDSL